MTDPQAVLSFSAESLRQRLDRYSEVLDGMREAFLVMDWDFRVIEINALGLQLESRPFEELVGRTHWELWPASIGTPVEDAYRKVMQKRVSVSLRHHYVAEQLDYWLEIKAFPVSEGVAVVYREITPTVQSEISLRQSEARFRAAVRAVGVMWTNDASGRMKGLQPGWGELTGQSEAEYQGYGWAAAVHPEDAQPTIDAWNQAVATRRTFEFEHRVRRRDGEWRNFSIRAVPVIEGEDIREWVGVHVDITDQSKAVAELTASELRSQTILESITDGFFTLDREWRFDYVNPEAERILDCTPGSLLGKVMWEVYPGSLGTAFEKTYRRVAGGNEAESFVAFYPDHGRWYDVRAFPLSSGLSVYFRDVTEDKQSEAALRASEGRWRLALESAELGAWNIDSKGQLTADERFCTIFAGSSNPLGYADAVAAVHADDRARVTVAIAAATRVLDPAPYAIEYRVVRPEGDVRWVFAKGRAQFEGDGPDRQLISFDGTVADVTDRKNAEDRLNFSEARFRTLFESIDEGFCVVEVMFEGDVAHDYRFLEVNPAFERHNGLRDVVGRTMRDFAPDMDPVFFEIYGRVVTTGEPIRFNSESKALQRWFDVYAFRLGDAVDCKVALLITDISARRRAEEDLRKVAAALSEADRRKDEFLATLAHELRNPLAAIRTGLEVVARNPGDPQRAQRVVGMVDRQSRLLVKLVDDLMDVSRVATGKVVLQQDRLDLRAVLELGMEVGQTAFGASPHEVRIDLPAEPVWIRGDSTRLAQVVGNLVNNAGKYTPDGGCITVSLMQERGSAILRVSDTGVGIPPEQLDQVFEMFTQVDRTLDRARGGLGIGLSLVRRLIELHGGTVNATSEGVGRGSTFTVRLPALVETSAGIPGEASGIVIQQASRRLKILIVDDNEDVAEGLAALLDMDGHETRIAYDGVSGLKEVDRFKPDIVFCDIGMPGMNGHEVARAVRSKQPTNGPFLVAVTGWGTKEDRQLALEAGFDAHCTKPITAEQVDALVARF